MLPVFLTQIEDWIKVSWVVLGMLREDRELRSLVVIRHVAVSAGRNTYYILKHLKRR